MKASHLIIPILAASASVSFGQLTELYRNSDGWYEIDAPNSGDMRPPFSDADGNKFELGGKNGALEEYHLIMDMQKGSNQNLRFGKHPSFGSTNEYSVGKLTIQNFSGGTAVDINSADCEPAALRANDLLIGANTASYVFLGWNMKSIYAKNASIENNGNVFLRYVSDNISFGTLNVSGTLSGAETVIGGTKTGTIGALNITANTGSVHIGSDANPTGQGAAYFTESLTIGDILAKNNSGQVKFGWNSQNFTAGDITFENNSGQNMLAYDSQTVSTGSLTFKDNQGEVRIGTGAKTIETGALNFSNNSHHYNWIGAGSDSLAVNGNVDISQTRLTFGADFAGAKSAKVNGDVNIDASAGSAAWVNGVGTAEISGMGTSETPNLSVSGVVKLTSANGNTAQWFYNGGDWSQIHSYVKIGGLEGGGTLATTGINGANGEHEKNNMTVIEFTNSGKSEFKGLVESGSADQSLSLVMNGPGTQILRLENTGTPRPDNFSLRVIAGHMGIYNDNTSRFGKISLDGGTLEVAHQNANYNPDADYMGSIYTDKLEINGDARILFDIAADYNGAYDADLIEAGEVSGDGIVTLMIELDADYFADGKMLDESFRILQIGSNNYDWAKAVVRVMYNGADITDSFTRLEARFSGNENGGSVYADIAGVVPEPAAAAALAGIAVLGLAAFRRRK